MSFSNHSRELGIPCVIGIGQDMKKIWDEKYICVDGDKGKVYSLTRKEEKNEKNN